jgi:tetratricopeptide (TPR) repeat protein
MSPDAGAPREDEFVELLAACDEALAAEVAPPAAADVGAPEELATRLERGLRCLRRLQEWRASQSASVGLTETPTHAADPLTPPEAPPPERVGRFTLRRELGRGGFGIVYLAYDPELRRDVALKVPHAPVLVTPELRARFRREAQAAAALDHPNVVPVYEAGEAGPLCYLVSAYCPGTTLAHWLAERTEPVPFADAVRLVRTLADAVQHAHSRGVLHRDLKPANVLLQIADLRLQIDPTDQSAILNLQSAIPKIADFGLARIVGSASRPTRSGAVMGTPCYMAPEQALGKTRELGPAVDVYGLGAMLYEVLTGRPPFGHDGAEDTLAQVMWAEPVPPSRLRPQVPRELETICLKCLQKEPAGRYAGAAALADDLGRFLDGRPILARPLGRAERVRRWCRRRPLVTGLLAALLLLGLGGGAGVVWQWRRAEAEAAEARRAREQADRAWEHAEAVFANARDSVDRMAEAGEELSHQPHGYLHGQALLQKALDSYQALLQEKGTDPVVIRRKAKAHLRVGELQAWMDQRQQAAEEYRRARELLEGPAGADPLDPEARQLLARCSKREGYLFQTTFYTPKLTEAEAAYRRAVALEEGLLAERPGDPEDALALAESLLLQASALAQLGHPERAGALRQRAYDLLQPLRAAAPGNPRYFNQMARCLASFGDESWQRRHWSAAEDYHRRALRLRQEWAEREPQNATARAHLAFGHAAVARLLRDAGRPQDGLPEIRQAVRLREQLAADFPAVPGYRVSLASAVAELSSLLRRCGHYAEAEETARRSVALAAKAADERPRDASARWSLADNHWAVALVLEKLERPAEALREYEVAAAELEKLAAEYPEEKTYRVNAAHRLYDAGRMARVAKRSEDASRAWRRAAEVWRKLATEFPGRADYVRQQVRATFALGYLFETDRDYPAAQEAYRQTLALNEQLIARFHAEAGDRFNRAWDLSHLSDAYAGPGQLTEAVHFLDQSVEQFRRLADEFPGDARYRTDLASRADRLTALLLRAGKTAEADEANRTAVAAWQQLVDTSPDRSEYRRRLVNTLLQRGRLLQAGGRYAEAGTALRAAVDVTADHAVALNNLAWFLLTCPDTQFQAPAEARALAERAVQAAPKNGAIRNTLGVAYYRTGDYQTAIAVFEEATRLRAGGDSHDWFFLAMAHARRGSRDQARTWFDQAARWMEKNAPDDDQLRRLRAEAAALLPQPKD